MLPHAGPKPLNYTIFKALAKKDSSRKQLHPWQVSKVSQLQYYLVKILQVNEFFTRLKNARRFPSFGTFINNEMLQNFEGENYGLVHGILGDLLRFRKALLL